jgi:hypothetical protein
MANTIRPPLTADEPWPGLDAFEEADSPFFYGRSAEALDILRLIQREPVTILFGRSGFGKTSLLKAGVFPLLRNQQLLPVYLRIDYVSTALAREQIVKELVRAFEQVHAEAPTPLQNQNLWQYFHGRSLEFWSARNRPVTPVLVLDQFEELFTFGRRDDATRAGSATFVTDLAALIENRVPDDVRSRLEADPSAAQELDFKRPPLKIVLSLREDFLPDLESLKATIPSVMSNRYRLQAMRGRQAKEVVTQAGAKLLDDGVPNRILALSWRGEAEPPVVEDDLPQMEVDPAVLSVVCSELNIRRRAAGLDRISVALLKGSDREILSGFYERGMAGVNARVRTYVEECLVTRRGFRDSRAMDEVLAIPGITQEAIDLLIANRLLRLDTRTPNVPRLELTHDVLARVVTESRDRRRIKEAESAVRRKRGRTWAAAVAALAAVIVVLFVQVRHSRTLCISSLMSCQRSGVIRLTSANPDRSAFPVHAA